MAFDSDYWHALDKQSAENLEVSPKDIGISMGAGDVLEGMKSAINMGAGTVELGFTGAAKGSLGQGSTTPEMFGTDKREAIRQLAKINEVNVTTHATIGAQGLAGFDQRSGFSDTAAATSLQEIKRAIDFAADTTRGGPVTVHTGEFPREVREAPGKYFEPYPLKEKEVPKEEIVALVDKSTGRLMPFQKGQVVWEPEWKKNPANEFVDAQDNPLRGDDKWNFLKRVPITDKEGNVKFERRDWNNIEDEAKDYNKDHPDKQITTGQYFLQKMRESEIQRHKPYIMMWEEKYKELEQMEKECEKQYENFKHYEKSAASPEAMDELREYALQKIPFLRHYGGVPEDKTPSQFIYEKQMEFKRRKDYEKEGWIGLQKEIKELERMKEDVVPMDQFGIERSAKNIARAATYAFEREKQMKLEKPLFVAPENIFPETGYGSHPEELRKLVIESRKTMAKELVEQRGYSHSDAEQIAKDHIKATFDIGHAYTWKKFFRVNPGESFEQTEKRFNDWLLEEVDKLNKEGIIGHIHLSDNFGYYDEHLTPGTGSVPLKEFVEKMKQAGHMEPMIAEGGAQAKEEYYQAMTGGWKHIASSPIYRTARWTDIEDSYFERLTSPSYIVGKYAPSQEYLGTEKGAPFWSGLGLE